MKHGQPLVNTAAANREKDLLETAFDMAKRNLGLRGKILNWELPHEGKRHDALVQLHTDDWNQDFVVEIKTGLRPQALGLILLRLTPQKDRALLVTDYVTPPIAETLKEHGIQFIDTAGNAYIHNPPVHIWVKGERPIERTLARDRGRAFAPSGIKVVLALLCRPGIVPEVYRDIAVLAGVAHGTVGWVMPELEAMGFIGHIGGKRKLLNAELLLERWAEAYLRVLRPKLVLGRFRTAMADWWKEMPLNRYGAALGGELAAAQVTKYLRPGAFTLYAHRVEPRMLAELKMQKDNFGDVEILRRFWAIDPNAEVAPLPVVYADLVGTGDARNLEAAKLIREKFLARPE